MTTTAISLNTTPLTEAHWRQLPPALRARLRRRLGGKAAILNRPVLNIAQALCERGDFDLTFDLYRAPCPPTRRRPSAVVARVAPGLTGMDVPSVAAPGPSR
jgi:hypothetical protein